MNTNTKDNEDKDRQIGVHPAVFGVAVMIRHDYKTRWIKPFRWDWIHVALDWLILATAPLLAILMALALASQWVD